MISIRLEDPDGAAAARRPPRPVPHAARPARAASGRCCATTRSRGRPTPATTGSPSSASRDGAASGYLHTGSRVGDQLDVAAPRGTFILDQTRRAGAADQRRHRRHPGPRHAPRARGRSTPSGRSGGCTARAAAATTRSPPRPGRCSPRSRTSARHVCYSRPGPDDREGRDFDSAAGSPRRCSPSSSRRATPRPTSAGRRRSWTRSAPAWPRSGSTPRASTPSRSGPRRA